MSSAMAFAGNKDLKPDAEKSAVPLKNGKQINRRRNKPVNKSR